MWRREDLQDFFVYRDNFGSIRFRELLELVLNIQIGFEAFTFHQDNSVVCFCRLLLDGFVITNHSVLPVYLQLKDLPTTLPPCSNPPLSYARDCASRQSKSTVATTKATGLALWEHTPNTETTSLITGRPGTSTCLICPNVSSHHSSRKRWSPRNGKGHVQMAQPMSHQRSTACIC